jgi:hypothetical protein
MGSRRIEPDFLKKLRGGGWASEGGVILGVRGPAIEKFSNEFSCEAINNNSIGSRQSRCAKH